jgi:hypothetical protein
MNKRNILIILLILFLASNLYASEIPLTLQEAISFMLLWRNDLLMLGMTTYHAGIFTSRKGY